MPHWPNLSGATPTASGATAIGAYAKVTSLYSITIGDAAELVVEWMGLLQVGRVVGRCTTSQSLRPHGRYEGKIHSMVN